MKSACLTLALLLFCPPLCPQSELPHPAGKRTPIHAQGCTESGVENNCLLVRDLHNGKLYNLLIKGVTPPIGIGIEFSGEPHNGPSTCMQGIAVDVTAWSRKDSLHCRHSTQRQK